MVVIAQSAAWIRFFDWLLVKKTYADRFKWNAASNQLQKSLIEDSTRTKKNGSFCYKMVGRCEVLTSKKGIGRKTFFLLSLVGIKITTHF